VDAHVPQRAGVVRLSAPSSGWRRPAWWAAVAWTVLLAWLPWWLDLPLLLAVAIALLISAHGLGAYTPLLRRALRWGLPGLLLAGLRALDRGPVAWVVLLLGALIGFSLLVLLESWLDRGRPRVPSPSSSAEWGELALAPVGPAAAIIELQSPAWLSIEHGLADPRGGELHYAERSLLLANGRRIEGVESRCCFSPDGRWLAVGLTGGRGLCLHDRQCDKQYRLRGWRLYGWQAGEPWLSRGEDRAPLALGHVLGRDDSED
jgi:hypothetical protein